MFRKSNWNSLSKWVSNNSTSFEEVLFGHYTLHLTAVSLTECRGATFWTILSCLDWHILREKKNGLSQKYILPGCSSSAWMRTKCAWPLASNENHNFLENLGCIAYLVWFGRVLCEGEGAPTLLSTLGVVPSLATTPTSPSRLPCYLYFTSWSNARKAGWHTSVRMVPWMSLLPMEIERSVRNA